MLKHPIALVLMLIGLFGCAGNPSSGGKSIFNTNTPADIGTPPKDSEKAIRYLLKYELKDPDSMKLADISKPVQSSCNVGIYGKFHGWQVVADVNAKNAFGAYVGYRKVVLWTSKDVMGLAVDEGFGLSLCSTAAGWKARPPQF